MIKKIIKKGLGKLGYEYKYGFLQKSISNELKNIYHREIFSAIDGNTVIKNQILTNKSFLVSRIGASELLVILNYLHFDKIRKKIWPENLRDEIWRQSGVFPTDDATLNGFSIEYINAIKNIDTLAVWYNEGENFIAKKFCPSANLIPLESLEPYFYLHPWSETLSNKNVLVIHPFEDSIKFQYAEYRSKIFQNDKILPSFNLLTLKTIQTQVYNKSEYRNWFEVLEIMKSKIKNIDFDIAIVGAGAYGLPLAAYVKSIGKQAIHMGGATQLLFGIKGKRWQEREKFMLLFNEYWKYPYAHEKPPRYDSLEGGAYW